MAKKKKTDSNDLSFLECVKVLVITLIAILTPSLLIGYVIKLVTNLNIFIGTGIGVAGVLLIGYALGLHKPASENEYDEDEDEDDD